MVTKSNDLSYTFLEAFLKSVIPLAKQNKGWEDASTGSRYTIFLTISEVLKQISSSSNGKGKPS